ncbi:MAG TPA: adenosylcobinamide-phosphate synthase CbiB [Polyangiales bacterium]
MSPHAQVLALAGALLADACFETPNALHPVAWFGTLALAVVARSPTRGRLRPALVGAGIALGLPLLAVAAAQLLLSQLQTLSPLLHLAAQAFFLHATFALFGLLRAGQRLAEALRTQGLDAARVRLRWLCSRDPSSLDATGLVTGTIESLAENLSDSLVAPLFFWLCAGLPGALAYRAVNTLDAMIGYHGRYEWLGKTSARLDDLANLIPARLTALLLATAALSMDSSVSLRLGLRTWWHDRRATASPNAGHPMSMAAGLLGVRLDKSGHYVLGATLRAPELHDVERCVVLVRRAGLLACVFAGWLAWQYGYGAQHGGL